MLEQIAEFRVSLNSTNSLFIFISVFNLYFIFMSRLDLPEYAEDAAILRFYHLDSLDSETWIEDEQTETAPNRTSTFHHPEQPSAIRPSESDMDLQAMDDSDPLGVYRSIFPE